MNELEVAGKRAFFHPRGTVSFERGSDMIARAMKQARALGVEELVVNIIGLTGFEPLRVFQRYAMATRWAECAGAAMRVVWVAKAELIDSQRIGLLIAQNRGAIGEVFDNEADALAWLDGRSAPGHRLPDGSSGVRPAD